MLDRLEVPKPSSYLEFNDIYIHLPYTQALLDQTLTGELKVLKIVPYEGKTDLYDHLDNFRYAMEAKGANEATRCRVFPMTLKGPAINWFKKLPSGSISSFADLAKVFLNQHMIMSE